jgi:casein kinase II subunit alpha
LNYSLAYKVATPGYKSPEIMLKQKKYDYRFDTYSAGCVLAGILFRDAPFFDVQGEDEPQWHSTVLVRGIQPFKEIDLRKKMKKEYRDRWRYVVPMDLFEDFKDQKLVDSSLFPEYEEAFNLMEQMLTINYEERPMVSDLFDHPFFSYLTNKKVINDEL